MWSADGATIYYVSEHHGTANVVKLPLASLGDPTKAAKPVAVTSHTDEAVRQARISKNGEWIVYECGGDLWVVGTDEEYRAAQGRHRGQRRREEQQRARDHVHAAARPSSP